MTSIVQGYRLPLYNRHRGYACQERSRDLFLGGGKPSWSLGIGPGKFERINNGLASLLRHLSRSPPKPLPPRWAIPRYRRLRAPHQQPCQPRAACTTSSPHMTMTPTALETSQADLSRSARKASSAKLQPTQHGYTIPRYRVMLVKESLAPPSLSGSPDIGRPSTLFMNRRDSPRREPDLQRLAPCRDVVML